MRGVLTVEPQESFDTWLRELEEMGPPAEQTKWQNLWDKLHPAYNSPLAREAGR
jgi:hypothetical protein